VVYSDPSENPQAITWHLVRIFRSPRVTGGSHFSGTHTLIIPLLPGARRCCTPTRSICHWRSPGSEPRFSPGDSGMGFRDVRAEHPHKLEISLDIFTKKS
jgi:hypothetical protein